MLVEKKQVKAPCVMGGKHLRFEETFVSPIPQKTELDAARLLIEIRRAHPRSKGWVEFDADILKTPSGYVAVRHHALYN